MNLSIYRYALEANNATRRESKEQGFQAQKTNTCRHYLVCNSRDVCRGDSRVSRSLYIYTQQILEQQSGRDAHNKTRTDFAHNTQLHALAQSCGGGDDDDDNDDRRGPRTDRRQRR